MNQKIWHNTTIVLTAMICLLIFAWTAAATEFQADFIQKRQGMEVKGTFFVKGKKTRMDFDMMGQKTSIITRIDKKVIWNVQHDAGMYIEMPIVDEDPATQFSDEELENIAVKKKIGSEKVNGYMCNKYEIIYHDKQKGKITTWVSKKLNFPIKMIYNSPHGKMYTEYKNIKIGKVKDSFFDVPQGLQKMSMPAIGGGMGGMMPKQ